MIRWKLPMLFLTLIFFNFPDILQFFETCCETIALVPSVVVLAGPKAAFGTCWVGFGSSPVPSTRERRIHFDPSFVRPGRLQVSHHLFLTQPRGSFRWRKLLKERSVRDESSRIIYALQIFPHKLLRNLVQLLLESLIQM